METEAVDNQTKTKSKYNTNCCVFGCNSRKAVDRSIHFHTFPKPNSGTVNILNDSGLEMTVDRRIAWEKALLMSKPASHAMLVCSKHFKPDDYCGIGNTGTSPRLKKNVVPSLNLPQKTTKTFEMKRVNENPTNNIITLPCGKQIYGIRPKVSKVLIRTKAVEKSK